MTSTALSSSRDETHYWIQLISFIINELKSLYFSVIDLPCIVHVSPSCWAFNWLTQYYRIQNILVCLKVLDGVQYMMLQINNGWIEGCGLVLLYY